jgi:hypothetical protein
MVSHPKRICVVTAAVLLLALPRGLYGYVDPGTGAMVWQLVIASAIGTLFYARRLVKWIKKHF